MAGATATIERVRTPDKQAPLLAAAHTLALAAFFLPWVEGSFGERSALSGLAIAELSPERTSNALLALVGPYAWALYLLPALAIEGLALALLGKRFGLGAVARPLSVALACPAVAALTLVLAYLATEGELVSTIGRAPAGLLLLVLSAAVLGFAVVGASRAASRSAAIPRR